MEKEITGYKLKDEKFNEAALILSGCKNNGGWCVDEKYDLTTESKGAKKLREIEVLDLWFEPVYKEETTLEVGKWYNKDNSIAFYQGEGVETYGINHTLPDGWIVSENWFVEFNGTLDKNTPASDKEVEEALIKEAKKIGVKEGVKFKNVGSICKNEVVTITDQEIRIGKTHDDGYTGHCVYLDNSDLTQVIFYKGKWAEIIEEPKQPEFTKEERKLIARILEKL